MLEDYARERGLARADGEPSEREAAVMSCGKPHETPCSEVLDRIYDSSTVSWTEPTCSEIRQHLDECGPCLREYGLEEAVKKLVHKSCGCDAVPQDLRSKVLGRIEQVRASLTE